MSVTVMHFSRPPSSLNHTSGGCWTMRSFSFTTVRGLEKTDSTSSNAMQRHSVEGQCRDVTLSRTPVSGFVPPSAERTSRQKARPSFDAVSVLRTTPNWQRPLAASIVAG